MQLLDDALASVRDAEPVAKVVSSGEHGLPLLQWISADHSLSCSVGDMLCLHPTAQPKYCPYPDCNCPIDKTTVCGRGLPDGAGADELLREARKLLSRYRNDTPLGHQPHMIAHEASECISRIDAHLTARSAT